MSRLQVMRFGVLLTLSICGVFAQCVRAEDAATEKEKPPFEELFLTTKDEVRLKVRFYSGAAEKTTVPIILMHRYKGQGSELYALADHLRSEAGGEHAVIVPDLRGHGQSVEMVTPGDNRARKLDPSRFRRPELSRIITMDLEAVKKFLIDKNNAGELNIEMLTVIAMEQGAVLAMNWIAQDWSWPMVGGFKQGQDVKAFVLVSPHQSFKGINIQDGFSQPNVRSQLSALFMCGGKEPRTASTTRRLYNIIKRHHADRFEDDEDKRLRKDHFLLSLDTSLQGTKLINQADLKAAKHVSTFLNLRLVEHRDQFPWAVREKPAAVKIAVASHSLAPMTTDRPGGGSTIRGEKTSGTVRRWRFSGCTGTFPANGSRPTCRLRHERPGHRPARGPIPLVGGISSATAGLRVPD